MCTFLYRKVFRIYTILMLLLLSLVSQGQQKKYSLPSLVDSARNYFPTLAEKQALVGAANASITDTRHSFLPRFKINEQINIASDNSLAGSYFTYGITPSTSAGVRVDNTFEAVTGNIAILAGEYELYNFGLNGAKVKNAQAIADLQQADLSQQQYLLDAEIARLYFILVKSEYRLTVDLQNTDRYKQIYAIIRALTLSGINPGADSSLAKAELSRAIINAQQTLGLINQVKEQLSQLTGIPSVRLGIDTAGHDFKSAGLPALNYEADTLHHPLIEFYKKYQTVFATTETVIRKTYQPKILLNSALWARGSSIQYNDQFKSLGTGLGYQRFNYALGVAISYDLFSSMYRKDKLAINKFRYKASEAVLLQQELNLASASRQADLSLQTIQQNLAELPVQLESAQATFNQKMAQYKAGLISLIDLTNASFVLYRSQTDFIESRNDWFLAKLAKAKAAGHLAEFIQSIN